MSLRKWDRWCPKSKERVLKYIDIGTSEGATVALDGRKARVPGYERGFFIGPSIFDDVSNEMKIAREEIFGPVASVVEVENLDEAIKWINTNAEFGNAASIFT